MKGDLYIAAERSDSTYENPRWCRIPASHVVPLLNEVSRGREIIQKYGVASVHITFNSASWGPNAVAEGLGLEGAELCVFPGGFVLRAQAQDLPTIETLLISIEAFESAVRKGDRFFVCDPRFADNKHSRDQASLLMAEVGDDDAQSEMDDAA